MANTAPPEKIEFIPIAPKSANPLSKPYTLWFYQRSNSKQVRQSTFELSLRVIANVKTIEEFWGVYTRLIRPSAMPVGSDIYVFEQGVTPTWEDPINRNGGKYIIRTTKEGTDYLWEEVLMAVLGNSLSCSSEVVGLAASVRGREDAVSLWIRDCSKSDAVVGALRADLHPFVTYKTLTGTEFKKHDAA
eukprot:PhF_6_TR14495/c0_g1_i1/m.23045/K03259/EIF4E; translation initiation factor 4E